MAIDSKKVKFNNLMFESLGQVDLGPLVDSIDLKILEHMSLDCRMSYAEISRAVNLSRMAVRARVLKMIESGLIERFTVIVSHRKLGLMTSVYLEVSCEPAKLDAVGKLLALNPKIESIYATTGSPILHIHAFMENFHTMEAFIYNEIYSVDGIINVDFRIMTKKYKGIRLFT
jgi:DNA-binding Lrp family transcriptional regulator